MMDAEMYMAMGPLKSCLLSTTERTYGKPGNSEEDNSEESSEDMQRLTFESAKETLALRWMAESEGGVALAVANVPLRAGRKGIR